MSKALKISLRIRKSLHPAKRPLTYSYLVGNPDCKCYGTSIYVSEKHPKRYFEFDHDLEEKFRDMNSLKELCKKRNCKIDVEKLKQDYERVKVLHEEKTELEELRHQNSHAVGEIVRQKLKTDESEKLKEELVIKGRLIKENFKHVQDALWDLEQTVMEDALSLPNDLLPSVTEKEEVLDSYLKGQEKSTDLHHLDIIDKSGEVVFSNVGHRAYYLRGRLALLEQTLINRFSKHLRNNGITSMLAPEMFTTPVVESGSIDVTNLDSINRMNIKHIDPSVQLDWQLDNTFLYGASHLSFLAYFARMVIDESTPDSQWFVVGRNYRASPEVQLPGLFGVLQSIKICMCSVNVDTASSLVTMDRFINMLTELYKQFNVPFRVVSVPVHDLVAMEMNRIELQMWVLSLKQYLKIASVSYCGEYNSRRLMIRYSESRNINDTLPVKMVHGEVTDIARLIAILLENDKIESIDLSW